MAIISETQSGKTSSLAPSATQSSTITAVYRKALQNETVLEERRVSFDLSRNIEYSSQSLHGLNKSDLWYVGDDIRNFKESSLSLAADIYSDDVKWSQNEDSYTNVMARAYESCCKDQACCDCVEQLRRWAKPELVGVEKWAVRQIATDRVQRRFDLWDTVIVILEEADRLFSTVDAEEQFLREQCENISRPSKRMARLIAEARAAAL